jgi:hypothetical protein
MQQLIITTKKQNPIYPLLISIMGIVLPIATLQHLPTICTIKGNNIPSFFTGILILQIIRSFINIKKNKSTKIINIIITAIGAILMGILGYFPNFSLYQYFPYFHIFLIFFKTALFICIGFFLYKMIKIFLNIKNSPPHALVDKKGIWIKDYNFIAWQNIATIKSDQINSLTNLKIIVKNKKQLFKQASFEKNIISFLNKKLRGYDIFVSNINNIAPDELLNFYHSYGKQNQ